MGYKRKLRCFLCQVFGNIFTKKQQYDREYRQKQKQKLKARELAVKNIPLTKCQFGSCSSTSRLERAHFDYDFPLEIIILCAKHHHLVDKLYRDVKKQKDIYRRIWRKRRRLKR